jgi:hypothetical protein
MNIGLSSRPYKVRLVVPVARIKAHARSFKEISRFRGENECARKRPAYRAGFPGEMVLFAKYLARALMGAV